MENLEINMLVGNDNGNSEHDIIINGYKIAQPNVIAKVRKLPMLDEVNPKYVIDHIEDNLIVTIDSPSVAPGIYYIGNYALKSGEKVRSIEVGTDNNKVESDIVIISTLAQIAGNAVKQVYKDDTVLENTIIIKAEMATSLPISQYSKANAEKFTNKFTGGKHKVTVHVGNIRADVEISFSYVKVIPEGVTSVHGLQAMNGEIFDDFNKKYGLNIDGAYLKNKRILHVAIGEGTTEYPLTTDISFNPNFIRGSINGVGHAIDKALDEFKAEKGLIDYSRQKYSQVLRDKGHNYHDVAEEIVEGYIEEQAEEILHIAKIELQKANNEVDIICCYGGGSIPMRKQLEPKINSICERAGIKLLYISEKFAVTLEAEGLYQFASGLIFKALTLKNKANK